MKFSAKVWLKKTFPMIPLRGSLFLSFPAQFLNDSLDLCDIAELRRMVEKFSDSVNQGSNPCPPANNYKELGLES